VTTARPSATTSADATTASTGSDVGTSGGGGGGGGGGGDGAAANDDGTANAMAATGASLRSAEALPWRYNVAPDGSMASAPTSASASTAAASAEAAPAPAFTLVACSGSTNIPFPVFMNRSNTDDSLRGWDKWRGDLARLASQRPFAARRARVVWRGGTHGKSCWGGVPGNAVTNTLEHGPRDAVCGRRRLRAVAAAWPSLFEVGYGHLDASEQLDFQVCQVEEQEILGLNAGAAVLVYGGALGAVQSRCNL